MKCTSCGVSLPPGKVSKICVFCGRKTRITETQKRKEELRKKHRNDNNKLDKWCSI